MKRVILYGDLAKRYGKEHRFEVKTVAEAVRAFRANFPDFEKYMCEAHIYGIGFKIWAGTQGLELDQIHDPIKETDVIRIAPVILGSGGFFKIILGAALVAVGVFLLPAGGVTSGIIAAGVGLVIGGVATLLTPMPEPPSDRKDKSSYIFSGPANKTNQGAAIPVGYGRLIVGSVTVSAGVETVEI